MKGIRALTFDLDDTLWDNRPVLLAAEQSLFDWLVRHYPRFGDHFTVERMRAMRMELAQRDPHLRYRMTELRKRSLAEAAGIAGYGEALVAPAFEFFLRARHRITPYRDVVPALQRLRAAGYLLGTLTNGNADVHRLGLGHLFHFTVAAEDIGHPKPEPEIFAAACRLAGVSAAELAHVGDEFATDIDGARAAGSAAIWMNRLDHPEPDDSRADATVRDMQELLRLMGTA
jgi:putative hydrolase of the HAD superfamily